MKEEIYTETTALRPAPAAHRRVSWGAIFAGFFITIVIQLTLTLLGAAIGAATINPLQEQNPTQGLALGSAIWLGISGLISLWVGTCVAGRLAGGPRRADGLLHGVVTWSLAELAMVLLLTSAVGGAIGGTGALISNALNSSNQGQGQNLLSSAEEEIRRVLPQAGALLPPTGRTQENQQPSGQLTGLARQDPELGAALAKLEAKGGASQSAEDRNQVILLLTSKHGMSQDQADSLLNQWDQNFRQAKAQVEHKAREAGDVAARGVSKGALYAFVAMILGLAVSAWGGWVGTGSINRREDVAVTSTNAP